MARANNLYESNGQEPAERRNPVATVQILLATAWCIAFFYPLVALGGIYLVVFMHSVLRMPGATIGNYESPMGVVFAASDEWHQSFVPDRFGTIQDVLIDGLGICAAGSIMLARQKAKIRRPKNS